MVTSLTHSGDTAVTGDATVTGDTGESGATGVYRLIP